MDNEQSKRTLKTYVDYMKSFLLKVKNSDFENSAAKLLNITLSSNSNNYSASQAIDVCKLILEIRKRSIPSTTYQAFSFESFVVIGSLLKELVSDLNSQGNTKSSSEGRFVQLAEDTETSRAEENINKSSEVIVSAMSSLSSSASSSRSGSCYNSPLKRKKTPKSRSTSKDEAEVPSDSFKDSVETSIEDEPSVTPRSAQSSSLELSAGIGKSSDSPEKKKAKVGTEVIGIPHGEISIELPDVKNLFEVPKKEHRIYQMINNIGFSLVKKDGRKIILFKCFFPGCPFLMQDEKDFMNHLTSSHQDVKWNGFCNVCHSTTGHQENSSLFEEMKHMKETHIAKVSLIPSGPAKLTSPVMMENLLKFTENFSEISSFNLRPWIKKASQKTLGATVRMKGENCLAAPYKCMEKRCVYFTSDESLFMDHLKLHKENTQDGPYECAYCESVFDEPKGLVKHVSVHHNFDVFQCSYCFYRSASLVNVQTHIHHYHPQKATVVIETIPSHKLDKRGSLQAVKQKENIDKFVLSMTCVVCKKVFYVLEKYQEHLESHEKSEKTLKSKCSKCGEMTTYATLFSHLEKCFHIAKYQCLLCLFGTPSQETIKLHYADNHAIKLPCYCTRSSLQTTTKQASSVTVKLLENDPEDSIIILKNINFPSVVNAENFKSLDYNFETTC